MNSPSGHGPRLGGGGEVAERQRLLEDLEPLARLLLAVSAAVPSQ